MRTILPPNAKLIPKEAKLAFKGVVFDVYQWPQKQFDGSIATFEMLKRPATVIVIAIKDNKIVVCDEEQPGSKRFLSLPMGIHDHDEETELEGIQRELKEETGMTFTNWRVLDVRQLHRKIEYFSYLFLATDFKEQVKQQLDVGEKIAVKLLSLDEVKAQAKEFRYPPTALLEAKSIEEVINLPEYHA